MSPTGVGKARQAYCASMLSHTAGRLQQCTPLVHPQLIGCLYVCLRLCQCPCHSHGSDSDDGVLSSAGSVLDAAAVPERSLLDTIILALWQEREEQGLFR